MYRNSEFIYLFSDPGQLCNLQSDCKFWGYTTASFPGEKRGCWLKSGRGTLHRQQHVISGKKDCPTNDVGKDYLVMYCGGTRILSNTSSGHEK